MATIFPDFRTPSKSGPVANQPFFDHSKSRQVQISDPHCYLFLIHLPSKIFWYSRIKIPFANFFAVFNSDFFFFQKLIRILHPDVVLVQKLLQKRLLIHILYTQIRLKGILDLFRCRFRLGWFGLWQVRINNFDDISITCWWSQSRFQSDYIPIFMVQKNERWLLSSRTNMIRQSPTQYKREILCRTLIEHFFKQFV